MNEINIKVLYLVKYTKIVNIVFKLLIKFTQQSIIICFDLNK